MKPALRTALGFVLSLFAFLVHAQEAMPDGELAPQVHGGYIVLFGVLVLAGIAWFVLMLIRNERKAAANRTDAE
jgi:hypothetical protein